MSFRVAVLGASGIGRYHVRELLAAGAEVVAIQGSSTVTAAATAAQLRETYGVEPRALVALDEVLAQELDAVAIATPHELHAEACLRALTQGLWVFCEKPLHWAPGLTVEGAKPLLAELSMAGADRRLAVNTSNATFVEALATRRMLPDAPRSFRFLLQTPGDDEGEEIAVDLLPHALSLVRALEPEAELTEVRASVTRHEIRASFRAGELAVELELGRHHDLRRAMTFAVDDVEVERVQQVDDGRYRVFLRVEDDLLEVEDPLGNYVHRFAAAVRGEGPLPVDFRASAGNLLDMLRLIEAGRAAS